MQLQFKDGGTLPVDETTPFYIYLNKKLEVGKAEGVAKYELRAGLIKIGEYESYGAAFGAYKNIEWGIMEAKK